MRILVAVDGSDPSQDAIDGVVARPWPAGSMAKVISVVRPYVPPATEFVVGAFTPKDVFQQHERGAREIADGAATRVRTSGLPVEVAIRHGDPRTEIVDEAAEWEADLVVVGSHGHTGLTRLLLGSVAQAVVAHAPCSVEVVRRRRAP